MTCAIDLPENKCTSKDSLPRDRRAAGRAQERRFKRSRHEPHGPRPLRLQAAGARLRFVESPAQQLRPDAATAVSQLLAQGVPALAGSSAVWSTAAGARLRPAGPADDARLAGRKGRTQRTPALHIKEDRHAVDWHTIAWLAAVPANLHPA
jgi:hypothetical protein